MSRLTLSKRFFVAVGILPFFLVTLFFDPYITDTGTSDAVTPEPTIAAQSIINPIDWAGLAAPASVQAAASTLVPPSPIPTAKQLRPTATAISAARINGIPLNRIVVMPDAVRQHVREIYAAGQSLGRNPHAFSKVGDSTMVYPPFLAAFAGSYKLGPYASLQQTISLYPGSFARASIAAKKGMHTWTEFDPTWVDSPLCQPAEGPLACEFRLNNPSVAIIRLGANDTSAPELFDEQLRKIIDTSLASGIIPVLGTKPDRLEGSQNTLNKMIAQASRDYVIPLWDYDAIVATIPGKGLEKDGVHFRGGGTHDYTSAKAFAAGDSLEDLTGLMMLDAIQRAVR